LLKPCVSAATGKKLGVTGFLLRGLGATALKEAECLARLRLGLTAIALEQYRTAHEGRYPVTLSEMTPEIMTAPLLDPFDGEPLRYRQKGAGYVLSSIGPDAKDDSGERKDGNAGDIIFAVVVLGKPQADHH